jgi:hypothetical protein
VAVIRSLGSGAVAGLPQGSISSAVMLGSPQRLHYTHTEESLAVECPSQKPSDYAYVFKITLRG